MTIKPIALVVLAWFLVLGLQGCGDRSTPREPGGNEATIVGTWSITDNQIMLRALANDLVGEQNSVEAQSPDEQRESMTTEQRKKIEARIVGTNTARARYEFNSGGKISIEFSVKRDGKDSIEKLSGSWKLSDGVNTVTFSNLGDQFDDTFLPLQLRLVGDSLTGEMRGTKERVTFSRDR